MEGRVPWARGRKARHRVSSVCGAIATRDGNRLLEAVVDRVGPRFRPHCGSGSGWGRKLETRHVFHLSCRELARRYRSKSFSRRVGVLRSRPEHRTITCRRSRGCLACGLRAVFNGPHFRICQPQSQSARVVATRSHGIILHPKACRLGEKAHAVRAAPQCQPDADRIAGNCELLHGGPTDGERREIQYA